MSAVAHFHEMPVIEVPVALCRDHYEEFSRRTPPKSVLVLCLNIFNRLLQDEDFVKGCGLWRPPPELWNFPTDGSGLSRLNETMRDERFRPWCEYLGEAGREAAWDTTPFLVTGGEN